MRVRYTPRARDDLAEILKYLDDRSPQAQRVPKPALGSVSILNRLAALARPGSPQCKKKPKVKIGIK
jgi:plasmid stabilization system protein ParE